MRENKMKEKNLSTPYEIKEDGYELIKRDLVRNSLIELSEKNSKMKAKDIESIVKSLEYYTKYTRMLDLDEKNKELKAIELIEGTKPFTVYDIETLNNNYVKIDSKSKSQLFLNRILEKITDKSVERFRKSLDRERELSRI